MIIGKLQKMRYLRTNQSVPVHPSECLIYSSTPEILEQGSIELIDTEDYDKKDGEYEDD